MFCALLGHTGERLQDHWSSGFCLCQPDFVCNNISMCDPVHDVETKNVLTASGNLF